MDDILFIFKLGYPVEVSARNLSWRHTRVQKSFIVISFYKFCVAFLIKLTSGIKS